MGSTDKPEGQLTTFRVWSAGARTLGAIGVFYRIEDVIEAPTIEVAICEYRKRYELTRPIFAVEVR